MSDTVFSKILSGEIPIDFLHEDDMCVAFNDISPQAPTHILVIPRHAYRNVAEASAKDPALVGHLLAVCSKLAQQHQLENGFRIVTNQGTMPSNPVAASKSIGAPGSSKSKTR
jgi:histidine triad (HIT) family protein